MERRAELEDTRGCIESDVRNAFLDLEAAASQLELSRANQKVARENMDLSRQKYDAGISNSLEVVQAHESAAASELDYITSLFAHNLAKLSLARHRPRDRKSPRLLEFEALTIRCGLDGRRASGAGFEFR
jgi:outer membrane protein TolC